MDKKYELHFWLNQQQKNVIENWCNENCSGSFIIHHSGAILDLNGSRYTLWFEYEEDLIAVKLRWM